MADYYAVLQRTLSGFSDPKPELRAKLYDRARSTIERQLESRNPPVSGEDLTAQLNKLEQAIIDTERGFDPDFKNEQPEPVEPEPVEPEPAEAEPVEEETSETSEAVAEPPPIPINPIPEPAIDPAAETIAETVEEPASTPEPEPEPEPEPVVEQIPDLPIDIPIPEETSASAEVPDPSTSQPEAEQPVVLNEPETAIDPVEQWADEFLTSQPTDEEPIVAEQPVADAAPAPEPEPAPTLPELEIPAPPPEPQLQVPQVAAGEAQPAAEISSTDELPGFDTATDETLDIPPAPGHTTRRSRRTKKSGVLKWILVLVLLAVMGGLGFAGWQSRDDLIDQLGLNNWFEDPTKPKPVKTITIKPEGAEGEDKTPLDLTKSENRASTKSAGDDGLPKTAESGSNEIKPAPSNALPVIAQSATLYEEGSTAGKNIVDTGRVLWSAVEEEPSPGLPKEPAIRARVEIPNRKLVLILTIKRNADKSFPATHLIELVFAVPDDFSGGGIGKIQNPVFKISEKDKGDALLGVPVDVSSGIFMVALENISQASEKRNRELMNDRGWIDIPMSYRTGRRAYITLEKGAQGEKVFKDVFAAWGN